MTTPRYFYFYDMPEFDAHYGYDPRFTERCDSIAVQLYELLRQEVGFLRQVPADCLSASVWDLCSCARMLVDSIDRECDALDSSCQAEAPQLAKLVLRFREYDLLAPSARKLIDTLWVHLTDCVTTGALEVAS